VDESVGSESVMGAGIPHITETIAEQVARELGPQEGDPLEVDEAASQDSGWDEAVGGLL
jgi:hypothetical protein